MMQDLKIDNTNGLNRKRSEEVIKTLAANESQTDDYAQNINSNSSRRPTERENYSKDVSPYEAPYEIKKIDLSR